jgi:hypothetical protein
MLSTEGMFFKPNAPLVMENIGHYNANNFSKTECGNSQIIIPQTQSRKTNQKAKTPANIRPSIRRKQRPLHVGQQRMDRFHKIDKLFAGRRHGEYSGYIGPNAHKTSVSQGEHAGKTYYQIHTKCQYGNYSGQVQNADIKAV